MPTYDFQGRDATGKLITGKRLANNIKTLTSELFKEGITPVQINIVKSKEDYLDAINLFFRGKSVSVDELSLFARQMHALLKTGVPVTFAFRQLAENTRSPQMANALYGITEKIEAGQDLVTAMQEYPHVFSPIMSSMVRVGMESGRLDVAFLKLNQYLELEASGLKRLKTALRYPAIVLLAVFCAIIFINILVIPTFAKIFEQANLQLPTVTKYMIAFSNFITQQWLLALFLLGGAIGIIIYAIRTPKGKYNWAKFQLKIPQVGEILRRVILLRFAQAFAITIEAGIPILEAMNLVGRTINNAYAEQEILNMSESIRHGKNLTQSAANSRLFTALELQMLSVSEETGQLTQMLEEMADFYRREVDYDIKKLKDIIEPLLIIILAIVILILAFSVYLPIWDMVKMAH